MVAYPQPFHPVSADESRWLCKARDGDLEAFEQLYRRYADEVYGACRRLLGSSEDAEDMTQRVFVRAWRRLGSFRGESRLGGWLRRIAVNLIIDERRAHWYDELMAPSDAIELANVSPGRTSEAAIDLERAIRSLPAGPRRVLVLHDVEGFTHREIGKLLGISVGTTKTQLFRARRALKEYLR